MQKKPPKSASKPPKTPSQPDLLRAGHFRDPQLPPRIPLFQLENEPFGRFRVRGGHVYARSALCAAGIECEWVFWGFLGDFTYEKCQICGSGGHFEAFYI
jgi:hypothetical protein